MTLSLKHATLTAKPDDPSKDVSADEWNEEHAITMATGRLLGRTTGSAGAVEEISVDATLTLAGGSVGVAAGTYDAAGTAAAAVATHEAAGDPHPGYLTAVEGDAAYQPLDADLTSIAALTTTTYGRGLLIYADEASFKAGVNLEIGTDVQAYDATLASIAGLGTAADKVAYTTGIDTWAESALTGFGRSIIDDADEAAFKATVNLEIGTDVQAYDAGLADIAGLAVTDGNIIVGDGVNWVAESGATARTSLGLGTGNSPQFTAIELGHATDTTLSRVSAGVAAIEGSNILLASGLGSVTQAYDAELAALAGLTSAADKLPYFTGSGTAAVADFSAFGRSLVDDANAAAARTTLGTVIGTDVAAHDDSRINAALPTRAAFVAGRYYYGGFGTAPSAAGVYVVGSDVIYWLLFHVHEQDTFTGLSFRVAAAEATTNAQVAIYADAGGVPDGAPILSSGNIVTTTTGTKTHTISQVLAPGWYWLGINFGGATGTLTLWQCNDNAALSFSGATTVGGEECSVITGQTFGTWPTDPTLTYIAAAGYTILLALNT